MSAPSTTGLAAALRDGAFLTRARMKLWGLAVIAASAAGLVYILLTAHGMVDAQGRPLGTDFSNVYAAGTLVLDGHPEAPFDPALQHAREQAIFGDATPFYGWHYPPFFLGVAGLLALMPYWLALVVWQGTTALAYVLAIRAIVSPPADGGPDTAARDPLWLLLAVAFPAVFVNLGHGHNGFLTAALIAGALLQLDRRPLLSGLLFGLIAYKPQFGVLIPLVLAATGRWRTFAAAAATVAALALATTLAFGAGVWPAFLASTRFTRIVVLESGDTGWHKIQSVFAWVRMWGGGIPLGYLIHVCVSVAVAAGLVRLWRSGAAFALKAAALPLAAILATPYCLDYDMMVLAPTIAFLGVHGIGHGFGRYEKTALAALWIVPLFARAFADATLVPIGTIAMLIACTLLLQRTKSEPAPSFSLPVPRAMK